MEMRLSLETKKISGRLKYVRVLSSETQKLVCFRTDAIHRKPHPVKDAILWGIASPQHHCRAAQMLNYGKRTSSLNNSPVVNFPSRMIPRGIFTPVPTFFKKDLKSIDFDTQTKHAQFLKDNGISGVVVMGSTGELAHLTREERAQVISNISKTVPGLLVLGGVGQHSVEEAVAEILSIKKAGATHALVLPSSYYGASLKQQGIIEWYTAVADRAELPILVYIYPGVTNNVVVEPTTVVKLAKHPNIVGTKISHGDMAHHTMIGLNEDVSANNFACFTGLGQILLPALSVGFQGTVDALSGAFPKLYVNILKSYDAGDFGTAKKLQLIATRGEELVVRFGVVGIKKAIFFATGYGETYLGRVPLNQDVSAEWESYAHYLVDCAEVEKTL